MITEGMQVVCDHPRAAKRLVYAVKRLLDVNGERMVEVDERARCPVCKQRTPALGPLPTMWFRPWECKHERSCFLGLQETKPDGDEAWMLRNCLDCETTFVERDADGKAVLVAWRR